MNNEAFVEKLKTCLERLNLTFNDKQLSLFLAYYIMVIDKNQYMNLTSIVDEDEFIEKHFEDSLSIILANINGKPLAPALFSEKSIIDVGTGAGFPGIPLKLAFPSIHLTLTDSLNKRILFLQDVVNTLELKHVTCVHARAEELGHNVNYREKYDFVVSRAVANLSVLAEYDLPFVKQGGYFLPYKGESIQDELNRSKSAINTLGGEITDLTSFILPGTDYKRNIVTIHKINHTPKKYPRKAGTPASSPL